MHEVTIQNLLKQVNIFYFVTFYGENTVNAVLGCNYLFIFAATNFGLSFPCQKVVLSFCSYDFSFFKDRYFGFYNYDIRVFSFSVLVTRKALFRLGYCLLSSLPLCLASVNSCKFK